MTRSNVVESPARQGPEQKRYLAALTSDLRKVNSAWDQSRLAAAIEEVARNRQAVRVRDTGSAGEIEASGRSE